MPSRPARSGKCRRITRGCFSKSSALVHTGSSVGGGLSLSSMIFANSAGICPLSKPARKPFRARRSRSSGANRCSSTVSHSLSLAAGSPKGTRMKKMSSTTLSGDIWAGRSGDFPLCRAGVAQPAIASIASSKISRLPDGMGWATARRKVGRTRFGSPRVAVPPGHVKADWHAGRTSPHPIPWVHSALC